jgi:hypothetical protein
MSAVILNDWEDETELGIITLASHLEDYQLAFVLNKHFKTHFKNNIDPINFNRRGRGFKYSVYKSSETKYTPTLFLIDNQSVQESSAEVNHTLFNSTSFIQSSLIESLKKWHYFMISTDAEWLNEAIGKIKLEDIIYSLSIDIKSLKQNEQSILYSITYD